MIPELRWVIAYRYPDGLVYARFPESNREARFLLEIARRTNPYAEIVAYVPKWAQD